ncbi:MAG TPA: OmpH family outer membrane protein [Pirellulales bacterium]|jgi:Skp family chaperone for outer membrane proteins
MRSSLLLGVAVGLISASVALAQPAKPVGTPRGVPALVDMTAIVQGSNRIKQEMDKLKAQYEARAQDLKKESERGNKMTEEFRKLPAGNPERKDLEQKVLQLRAEFELHGKRINDETREQESKIVYSMLRELQEELAKHARANGQRLILRYDSTPPDLNSSQAILAEIQKPIVYQRGAEITPAIVEALNRRTPPPVAGRQGPPTTQR